MKKKLTLQDFQLISAYLDDACSAKERILFEKRLQEEPELNQVFLEFSHTRRLLHAMPVRRAPRNFSLSPSRVPVRPRRFFLAPAMNFASLAAVMLLVVIFAGSRLFPGLLGSQNTAESFSPMAASLDSANLASTGAPMIIIWGQSGSSAPQATTKSGLGGGNGGVSSSSAQGSNPVPTAPPTLAAPMPSAAISPQVTQSSDGSSLILGLPAASEQGKIISPTPESQPLVPKPAVDLTLIEIILSALAVGCAVIALVLRKIR